MIKSNLIHTRVSNPPFRTFPNARKPHLSPSISIKRPTVVLKKICHIIFFLYLHVFALSPVHDLPHNLTSPYPPFLLLAIPLVHINHLTTAQPSPEPGTPSSIVTQNECLHLRSTDLLKRFIHLHHTESLIFNNFAIRVTESPSYDA